MKKSLSIIAASLISISTMAQAPAFPGAEGHGRFVTGGRDGKIYHVTNLNDSGTGSFREAVKSGNRIIVFDVAGVIALKSDLKIADNITILGQTAPSPGITLRYYTVQPGSNNIIRFIRIRRGQEKDINDGADASWQRNKTGIIFDHCSFSWSIDEVASFYDNKDFTMQWCNITEALANAGHDKGAHSYGGIWGGKNASFHHNFIAHVQNRAPRFNGARYNWDGYDKTLYENSIQAERVDFRNCVMYNWGNGNGCYGGPGGGYINMVNNYYKAGPGTSNKTRVTQVSVSDASNGGDNPFPGYASRYYINGNYVTAASSPENYDWQGVIYDSGLYTINGEKYIADPNHYYGEKQTYEKNTNGVDCIKVKLDEPIDAGEVTTHKAQTAFEKVLKYCGASFVRDACDVRYAEEAENGTTTFMGAIVKRAGILDIINDPEGTEDPTTASYPTLREEKRPADFDTDGDGIPDEWETANGLNPSDANDGNEYTIDSEGIYTNIEVYLNSLVEHIMKDGNADAEDAVNEYYPKYNSASGIKEIANSVELKKITYTTLSGQNINQADATRGVYIMVEHFADGSTRTRKVVK